MKKLIALFLIIVLSFSLVACADKGAGDTENQTNALTGEVLWSSFEESEGDMKHWSQGMQLLRVVNGFGKVSINKDAKYVKTGTQSIKIQPLGSQYVMLPLYSETFGMDLRNLSTLEKVSIQFYNDTDKNVSVAVGLIPTITTYNDYTRSFYEWQELTPGWNDYAWNFNSSMMSILYDISNVQALYIAFKGMGDGSLDFNENTPDIYCDDVKLVYSETPAPVYMDVPHDNEMEVAGFEHSWQSYVISDLNNSQAQIVKISDYVNKSTNEAMTTKDGSEHALRFHRTLVPDGDGTVLDGVAITREAFAKSEIFPKLSVEDYKGINVCIDLFNNSPNYVNLEWRFWPGSARWTGACLCRPYEWMTFKVNLYTIYTAAKTIYTTGGTQMSLVWADNAKIHVDGEEIFLDNIHFEWSETNSNA